MLLQPFANAGNCPFVSIRTWVRTVKYSNLPKQNHCHPTTFALAYLGTKLEKQCLDITPLDIGAHRTGKIAFRAFWCFRFTLKWHHFSVPHQAATIEVDPSSGCFAGFDAFVVTLISCFGQIMRSLQVEPEAGFHAEVFLQAQGGIGCH